MFVLMPLTCIYYPVNVLPVGCRWSLGMPPPMCSSMRALIMEQVFRADLMIEAFAQRRLFRCGRDRVPGAAKECPSGGGPVADRRIGYFSSAVCSRWLVPLFLVMAALLRRKSYRAPTIVIFALLNG
jgi:hypothetical protein